MGFAKPLGSPGFSSADQGNPADPSSGVTHAAIIPFTQATTLPAAQDILDDAQPFTDIASATTTSIGGVASSKVRITGTTTITGLGTIGTGIKRTVRFAGALTLTHNATSLLLPGEANITTAANDTAEFVSLGSGNWICTSYKRHAYPPATNTPAANLVTSKTTNALMQVALGLPEVLSANRTYYVSHAAGSNANTGLAAGAGNAWATITYAYAFIRDRIHLNGYQVVIQVADGTFDEIIIVGGGRPAGYTDLSSVIVRGNLTTRANCFNQHAGVYPCLSVYDGAFVRFEGMKFANASGTDHCVKVYKGSYLEIAEIAFGACARACMQAADGWITLLARGSATADLEITGNCWMVCLSEVGNGGIDVTSGTVTFTGSITLSGHPGSAFAVAGEGSYFACYNTVWVNTFTGRKYFISDNAPAVSQNELEDIPGSLEGVWTNPIVRHPEGRLTLTDATSVTTADVTAAGTLHYEPHVGDYGLFSVNSSNCYEMATIDIAGLSMALNSNAGHTGYHQSGKNFDVFLYRRGATAIPSLCTGPAWTNDTTRANAISCPNGIWANTASMVVRFGTGSGDTETLAAGQGVYIGTIRASANGQTEDSATKRFVWNAYNRVSRPMLKLESTDSWAYSTATVRQMNGSATNQIEFVRGLNEDSVTALARVMASCNVASALAFGIGLDATNAMHANCQTQYWTCTTVYNQATASWIGIPGLGYHFLAPLEYGDGVNTDTWYGDAGVPTLIRSGISGEVMA